LALIVEDGTQKTDAEAYDTVANVTAYLAEFNPSSAWVALSTAAQETVSRQATFMLDTVYGNRYHGTKASQYQALLFPRNGIFRYGFELLNSEIPLELRRAQAEMCKEIAEGNEILPSMRASTASLGNTRTKIGPLEFEKRYIGGKSVNETPTYPRLEAILDPIIFSEGYIERG
jgi:hypothetical protein